MRIRLKEMGRKVNPQARSRIISNFLTLKSAEKEKKLDVGFALWYLNHAIKGFPKLMFKLEKEEIAIGLFLPYLKGPPLANMWMHLQGFAKPSEEGATGTEGEDTTTESDYSDWGGLAGEDL